MNLFLCGFNTAPRLLSSFFPFRERGRWPPCGRDRELKLASKMDGARLDGGRRVINSGNGARYYYVKLHDVTADRRANRACLTMITKSKSCTRKSWGREKSGGNGVEYIGSIKRMMSCSCVLSNVLFKILIFVFDQFW